MGGFNGLLAGMLPEGANMNSKLVIPALTMVVLGWASTSMANGHGETVFRWVDANGNTHYGDRIPPEHSSSGHSVLNEQGVEVNRVDGEKTFEEKAEERRRAELLSQQRKARDAALLRDKVLLSTYLSVEEIESLRDRRIELVAGQIRVTEIYLDNLRNKLLKLEKEAQRFSPYSNKPEARPIDEKLARELSDTLDSIMLYEQNLTKSKNEQSHLMAKFDSDINRFMQLHSMN
jgi:hypothetical protein